MIELSRVRERLERLEGKREELIKRGRELQRLCRKTIARCAQGAGDEEEAKLVETHKALLTQIGELPELQYSNLYYSIVAEYVEALEFCSVVRRGRVLQLEELGVHPIPYLLGLADTIGELKRYSLEMVRRGLLKESMRVLEFARAIYEALAEIGYAETVVGLRRKLDVYRKVLDDWLELLYDISSRSELKARLDEALAKLNELP